MVNAADIDYNDNDYSVYPSGQVIGTYADLATAQHVADESVTATADGWDWHDISGVTSAEDFIARVHDATVVTTLTVHGDLGPDDPVWVVTLPSEGRHAAAFADGPAAAAYLRDECSHDVWDRWWIVPHTVIYTAIPSVDHQVTR